MNNKLRSLYPKGKVNKKKSVVFGNKIPNNTDKRVDSIK